MTLAPDDPSSVTDGDDPMFTIRGLLPARELEVGDDLHVGAVLRVESVTVQVATVDSGHFRHTQVFDAGQILDVTRVVDENLDGR